MRFQRLILSLALIFLAGCASTAPISKPAEAKSEPKSEAQADTVVVAVVNPEPAKKIDNTFLICKASRKRFHYDWSANSLSAGQEAIDQNNIRYEFRSANKPAGVQGENLKVGECGWASEALAISKKSASSQLTFKSLSDEATQTFYKMKTGKVFRVPVRQTKNGLVAAPGGVSVIR